MQPSQSTIKNHTSQSLQQIRELVATDLQAIDELIIQELFSDVPLIQTIAKHIIDSGGKRLRPLLVILSAKALNYAEDSEHYELAAIIEFIHTATLLHDDVVDRSDLRRNQPTANALWGSQASVLVGDFLYSRAFQILAQRNNIPVMKVLANTTNQISEGEVWQLMNMHDPELTEENYLKVIQRKTAELFSAATHIGAIISNDDAAQQKALADYGLNLGMAFQITDDLLDYTADVTQLGKNIGDDLAEGKTTLPLIYALHHGNSAQQQLIRDTIKEGNVTNIKAIIAAIDSTDAKAYTLKRAKDYAKNAQQALQILPSSVYRDALNALVAFVVEREF